MTVSVALKLMKSCFKDALRNEDAPLVHRFRRRFPTGSTPSRPLLSGLCRFYMAHSHPAASRCHSTAGVWGRSCLLTIVLLLFLISSFFRPLQWRPSSQVALSGSRSEGGGCHGSRGTCSLSAYDATHTLESVYWKYS